MDGLTQELLKSLFVYKDGNLIWKNGRVVRYACPIKRYTETKNVYTQIAVNGKRYLSQRLIWMFHYGYMPKLIDHINGIKSDNRIENLREATHSENSQNSPKRKNNTSGEKNICWHKRDKRWIVSIWANKNVVYEKRFKTLEEAKEAAVEARKHHHKEFARHL